MPNTRSHEEPSPVFGYSGKPYSALPSNDDTEYFDPVGNDHVFSDVMPRFTAKSYSIHISEDGCVMTGLKHQKPQIINHRRHAISEADIRALTCRMICALGINFESDQPQHEAWARLIEMFTDSQDELFKVI